MDGTKGTELWNLVREAGKPWISVRATRTYTSGSKAGFCPMGGDTDDFTNPFEVRMGKYVDLDVPDDTIGIEALRRISQDGVKRHQLGVVLDDDVPAGASFTWFDILSGEMKIGSMTTSSGHCA